MLELLYRVIFLHLSCWKFGTHILTPCCDVVKYAEIQAGSSQLVHNVAFQKGHNIFLSMFTDNNLFLYLFSLGFETCGGIGVDIAYHI